MAALPRDVEEPLLGPSHEHASPAGHGHDATTEAVQSPPPAENYWGCVNNLSKAVFGAGMMALPRACTLLGAYCGFGMVALVGAITWYSIGRGVVLPATRLMASEPAGRPSSVLQGGYSGLVRTYLGSLAGQLLNAFLLANTIGFSVMYVDVISDVLLGTDEQPGVAVELLHWLQLPAGFTAALLHRPTFIAALMACVVAPISLRRDMSSLGALNAIGLGALTALFGSTAWLACAAVALGAAHAVPVWPDVDALSKMSTGSGALLAGLSLLPVLLTASSCHLNIMPLAAMMKPYSARQMNSVTAVSLGLTSGFYIAFSAAAYVVFGEALQEDVLQNLRPESMSHLIGGRQAALVAYTVRVAYATSLLGNTAINNFPLRDALLDTLFTDPGAKAAARDKFFVPMTLGVLLLVYVLAVSVASMWRVIGFVGGVTSTGVCYLFPAVMMYKYAFTLKAATGRRVLQAGAVGVFAVGAGIMVNTLLRPL